MVDSTKRRNATSPTSPLPDRSHYLTSIVILHLKTTGAKDDARLRETRTVLFPFHHPHRHRHSTSSFFLLQLLLSLLGLVPFLSSRFPQSVSSHYHSNIPIRRKRLSSSWACLCFFFPFFFPSHVVFLRFSSSYSWDSKNTRIPPDQGAIHAILYITYYLSLYERLEEGVEREEKVDGID